MPPGCCQTSVSPAWCRAACRGDETAPSSDPPTKAHLAPILKQVRHSKMKTKFLINSSGYSNVFVFKIKSAELDFNLFKERDISSYRDMRHIFNELPTKLS